MNPFIGDSLCSVGGIICAGRVASPGDVFHQLQLYWTLSIGVEMRVVKSPSTSFIHISETQWRRRRGGAAHLFWLRCESECVFVCATKMAEHEVFPLQVPLWGWMEPLWKVLTPDWEIGPSLCKLPQRYNKIFVTGAEIACSSIKGNITDRILKRCCSLDDFSYIFRPVLSILTETRFWICFEDAALDFSVTVRKSISF